MKSDVEIQRDVTDSDALRLERGRGAGEGRRGAECEVGAEPAVGKDRERDVPRRSRGRGDQVHHPHLGRFSKDIGRPEGRALSGRGPAWCRL